MYKCSCMCAHMYRYIFTCYICIYVDKLRCQVNDCYHRGYSFFLMSFDFIYISPPFPYSMSLSCFWFIKNKIQKNLKKIFLQDEHDTENPYASLQQPTNDLYQTISPVHHQHNFGKNLTRTTENFCCDDQDNDPDYSVYENIQS